MRSVLTFLVVSMACVVITGCRGETVSDRWAGVVHPEVLGAAGLQYYWDLPLELDKGETITQMHRIDENLYCLTSRNRLFALDANRAILKWVFKVAHRKQKVFPPVHADAVTLSKDISSLAEILGDKPLETLPAFDAVMFNTLSEVFVLNRTTGETIRRISLDFSANTGGATDGAYFYVGGVNGSYHAIRLQEGSKMWTLPTRGILSAPLRYLAERVFVGGGGRSFLATQVGRRGRIIWRQPLRGPVSAPFHVDRRGCFVPCEDNRIYAFDLSGSPLWEPFNCQGPLRQPIQVGDNTIFQFADDDKFYAVNLVNGAERWSSPDGRMVLAILGTDVHLLSKDRHLVIVDEILGTAKRSFPLTGMDVFVGNTSAPAIYTATADGHLFCIRPTSAGYLSPELLKAGPSAAVTPAWAPTGG